ncbi:hypothetical protein BZA77DRAFT_291890 [Pyronema omphalodes]|nr:hypothetical protein BZA77DRAFT_296881 [Pyronema omphalodes]KAI5817961.1 hypothetical protein BZA77DRAFT_291890 [Pyronema omphalodes]
MEAHAPSHSKALLLLLTNVITFIRGTEKATRQPDIMNLRLVNRGFRYLLQPIIYKSVRIPRRYSFNPSVAHDVRQLLRLIDRNPSLATSIKHIKYHETHPLEMISVEYGLEDLDHDHAIFSRFARELTQNTSASCDFDWYLQPSQQHDMSLLYGNMCTAILFARLNNLRKLSFHGYVGGGYAWLLTPWAREIWEHMPLKALQVLRWKPVEGDYIYQRLQWPSDNDDYYYSVMDEAQTPNNDWNIISFLHFTPGLQELSFTDDVFLLRATPNCMPVMQFLTSIYIQSGPLEETSQCLLELLQCSPVLKKLEVFRWDPSREPGLQQALRLVRNSVEELTIHGEVEEGWPGNISVLHLLPPHIEALHISLSDAIVRLSAAQPTHQEGPYAPAIMSDLFSRLHQLLEDLALAKEGGPLKKLSRIRIEDQDWRLLLNRIPEEDRERLSAMCEKLGIVWD